MIRFLCREARLPRQSEIRPHGQAERVEIMRRLRTETETPTRERPRTSTERERKKNLSSINHGCAIDLSLLLSLIAHPASAVLAPRLGRLRP